MQRAVFKFSPEILHAMLTEDHEIHCRVRKGIPLGAKCVQSGYMDEAYGSSAPFFYMTLEHESFPVVKEGDIPECFTITVEEIGHGNQTRRTI